jgi:hypothetical protein
MNTRRLFVHVVLPKMASIYFQETLFPLFCNITLVTKPYTHQNESFNKLQYADGKLYNPVDLLKEIELFKVTAPNKHILISYELFSVLPFYNFINRSLISRRLGQVFLDA